MGDTFYKTRGTTEDTYQIGPSLITGPPTTGLHFLGENYIDDVGKKYICIAQGTPGTWYVVPEINHVNKASDTSRIDDQVPSADPDLVLTLLANSVYVFRGCISLTSSSSVPDSLVGFNIPANASMSIKLNASRADSGVSPNGQLFTVSGDTFRMDITAGGTTMFLLDGMVTTGATVGDIEFIWAQNNDNANATVVQALSYIEVSRR